MRKLLLVAIAKLSIACAVATDQSVSGLYGGVHGGIHTLKTHSPKINSDKVGGTGGVFGGYGLLIHDWYVAVQLQGDLGNFKRSFASTNSTAKLSTHSMLGATGLFGYQVVKNMVAYVAAGFDYAQWQYSDNVISRTKSNQLGFAPRFGIRTMISKNIFLNAEYKHTFFRSITISGGGSTFSAKPRVQTFTIGIGIKTN